MTDVPTPWIGLAALAAMFVLPFLPSWVFEGPRRIKHWPREHVCARCGDPWTDGHRCVSPVHPKEPSLHWELYRLPESSTPVLDLEEDDPASTPSRTAQAGTDGVRTSGFNG
jgi:hypothetical protein